MVGRSNEITGPYKDRNNVLMTSGGGSLVISSDDRWKGPGHCAVLVDGDKTWLVHHAYDTQSNGIPTLRIEKLIWDEENWPVVDNTMRVGEIKRSSTPGDFVLYQNYPNPFNPITTIQYSIPKTSFITIKVFDILGKERTNLINEKKIPGNYEIEFDGSKLVNGIYFYRMQAGDYIETKKMVLMK